MAGGPWQFTVSPSTINTVIITQGSGKVTVTKSNDEFYTNAFVETSTVTVSATGYQAVTVTAGTTSTITMIPITQNLYAWTNSSIGTIYTLSATPSAGDDYYKENGEAYAQYELEGDSMTFLKGITSVEEGSITLTGDRH